MKALRRFTVRAHLPDRLAALERLSINLRWSWDKPTQDLFAAIDPDAVEAGRLRSGGVARAGQPEAAGRARRRRVVRAPARRAGRRPGRLPDPAAVVPAAGRRGRAAAERHRVLLDGVRRRRGAAELLRWPRHSGRRPPEVGVGSGPAADRGRPVLPLGILPAVADRRRLAARELPVAGPAGPAAAAAHRQRRRPGAGGAGDAGRRPAAGARLDRAGRPNSVAAVGFRHPGERARAARRHRPALRRRPGTPDQAGDPGRHRRGAGDPRVHRSRGPACARGVPHERGPRRLPGRRAHPRADRRRAGLRHRADRGAVVAPCSPRTPRCPRASTGSRWRW